MVVGSEFDADQRPEHTFQLLSKIILCMETGQQLILKDVPRVYSSLYDMLNQSYTTAR